MPPAHEGATFAELTTLRAGGPAACLVTAVTRSELLAAIESAEIAGDTSMVVGQGSNLVVGDDGFDGTVIRVASTGKRVERVDNSVELTSEAGELWADLVASCVNDGLSGIECLAAIPGTVGATPVQNVGAYGQEVASTIERVEAWDRLEGKVVEFSGRSCGFGYRSSLFRQSSRWVILSVTFRLACSGMSGPLSYTQLTNVLDIPTGSAAPLREVHDAVVQVRRDKGMVLDPADPDTRSVGSFFTNPILDSEHMSRLNRLVRYELGGTVEVPRFPADHDHEKVSAAWLIESAGFQRGYRFGPAGISSKHALALMLHDGHSTEPLIALARLIRQAVFEKFGVDLETEPTLVATRL